MFSVLASTAADSDPATLGLPEAHKEHSFTQAVTHFLSRLVGCKQMVLCAAAIRATKAVVAHLLGRANLPCVTCR